MSITEPRAKDTCAQCGSTAYTAADMVGDVCPLCYAENQALRDTQSALHDAASAAVGAQRTAEANRKAAADRAKAEADTAADVAKAMRSAADDASNAAQAEADEAHKAADAAKTPPKGRLASHGA